MDFMQMAKIFRELTSMDYGVFLVGFLSAYFFIYAFFKIVKTRIVFPFYLHVFVVVVLTAGAQFVAEKEKDVKEQYRIVLSGYPQTYAAMLASSGIDSINLKTKSSDPKYLKFIEMEKDWLAANPYIADIYTFIKTDDGKVALLVDSETDYNHDGKFEGDREQRTAIGEIFDKSGETVERAFRGENVFNGIPYEDRWGHWISGYAPVFNSQNKKKQIVVGVDFPADQYIENIQAARLRAIGGIAGILLFVIAVVAFYQNLTLQLRQKISYEKRIQVERAMAIQSSKMASLGEMAGSIAHEINNPLMIIQGNAERMKSCLNSPEKIQELVGRIESTVDRIARIVRSLRNISRNTGSDPLMRHSLQEIVRDTFELCRERIEKNGARLELVGSFDYIINCRPSEISQVFLNLISNSLHAIENQSQKWVRMETVGYEDKLHICLTDSGVPISKEIIPRLMDPFFTTKEIGKGTGLGLSIVKSIVQGHSGRIWLDQGRPNTCFVIELPLAKEEKGQVAA